MRGLTPATRRAAWALLALALCVRLGFVAATPHYTPIHDDHDYDRLACSIIGGGGYSNTGPPTPPGSCVTPEQVARPTAYRPPGYPMALAALYGAVAPLHVDRWTVARVAQALLGTVVAGLIGLVAGLVWGRRAGLAALALAAVHLPFAMVGAALVSETLFLAFEVGAVACVLLAGRGDRRWPWIAAAGLLAGLAWLTRSNGMLLLLPLALAAWSALRPRGRRAATLAAVTLLGVAAVTISPWTIRNERELHGFVPVATELGPTLAGTYNNVARLDPVDPGAWWLPRQIPAVRAVLRRTKSEPARDQALTRMALGYMAAHPFYVVRVLARNSLRMAALTAPSSWREAGAGLDMPAAAGVLTSAWFWIVLVLAVAGVATGAARRAPPFLWLTAALMFLSAALVISGVRFRMPLEPFLVMLAGAGLARLASPALIAGRELRPRVPRPPAAH
jgi:4-amino-4-deoxy-L-arabinose transferase-like glycosyltransferase